jgi:hypothetical protein
MIDCLKDLPPPKENEVLNLQQVKDLFQIQKTVENTAPPEIVSVTGLGSFESKTRNKHQRCFD